MLFFYSDVDSDYQSPGGNFMKRVLLFCVLLLLVACQKKPIIIGDFNCENRVTFEELRENPEPYMYKEICFEVGSQNVLSSGVDVTRDDDARLVFYYKGKRFSFIEQIIAEYESGDTSFLPDAGSWNIYYNSILPIQLEGHYGAYDSLENKYRIPEEMIDDTKGKFIYTSENTDSLIFSGILFESNRSYLRDSLAELMNERFGKQFGSTRNHVYLTGAKIVRP